MSLIKKTFVFLMVLFTILWSVKIIVLNKEDRLINKITVYNMGETFYFGDLKLSVVEAGVMPKPQYEEKFGIGISEAADEDCIIYAVVRAENVSNHEIEWERVSDGIGFLSIEAPWCSSNWPAFTSGLNVVYTPTFMPGDTVETIHATGVAKAAFKEKTWASIDDVTFYYEISTYPDLIRIRLE